VILYKRQRNVSPSQTIITFSDTLLI